MKKTTFSLLGLLALQCLIYQAIGCAGPTVTVNAGVGDGVVPMVVQKQLVRAAQPAAAQPGKGAQPAPAGERFAFPSDKGGQALNQLLRPTDRLAGPLDDLPPGPHALPPPVQVTNPNLLPANPGSPLRPPLPKTATIRPRMMAEGTPLTAHRLPPTAPSAHEFSAGVLIALPLRDVNQPVPLGYVGVLTADRVPLEDPTQEASLAATLAAVPPARETPVPFVPQNLPDPFLNAQTVRLRTPPAELGEPPTAVHSKAPPAVPQTQPKQ